MVSSVLAVILITTLAVGDAHPSCCPDTTNSKSTTGVRKDCCSGTFYSSKASYDVPNTQQKCSPASWDTTDVRQTDSPTKCDATDFPQDYSPAGCDANDAQYNYSSSVEDSDSDTDTEDCDADIPDEQDQDSPPSSLPANCCSQHYKMTEITNDSYEVTIPDKEAGTVNTCAWFEYFLPQWDKIILSLPAVGAGRIRDCGSLGRSILHFLLSQENVDIEIFQEILTQQVDINVADAYGQTPLHLAVIMNKLHIVELLLENGADVRYPNKEGSTALDLALLLRFDSISTILLQHIQLTKHSGDDYCPDDAALHIAIHTDAPESVFRQLLKSAEGRCNLTEYSNEWKEVKAVFWRYPSQSYPPSGNQHKDEPAHASGLAIVEVGPLIHHAIYECRKQCVESLMAAGANPEQKDYDGSTPLHLAVEYCPEIVDDLIIAGVSINERNNLNQTALHLAAKKGNEIIVKKLIDAGASLLVKDLQDLSPIAYAEDGNCVESANLLKDAIAGEAVRELLKECPMLTPSEGQTVDLGPVTDELTDRTSTEESPAETDSELYTSDGYLSSMRTCLPATLIWTCIITPLIILL